MEVRLEKAIESDAKSIFDIQILAFTPLLKKYKDFNTNPAKETLDRVIQRINNPYGGFYKVFADNILVGAVCVFWREGTTQFWISPMFISPEFQGQGIAQKVIRRIEELFPQATTWELASILEEERNCYLYEKMGYVKTGVTKQLNDKASLIFYRKGTL